MPEPKQTMLTVLDPGVARWGRGCQPILFCYTYFNQYLLNKSLSNRLCQEALVDARRALRPDLNCNSILIIFFWFSEKNDQIIGWHSSHLAWRCLI